MTAERTDTERQVINDTPKIRDIRRRQILKVIGVGFLLFLLASGGGAYLTILTFKSAAEDGTQLAQQIKQKCEDGYVDPDLAEFCPRADEVVEAAPEQVKSDPIPGPVGPTGPAGADGTDGQDGTDGANGTDSLVAGPRGKAGSDSTVPGPVGPTGPAGKDGTNGKNGADGANGPAGPQGLVGPTGPAGLTGFNDNCPPAPEGQVISDVSSDYDPNTQTASINCSYKDDQQGGLLPTDP